MSDTHILRARRTPILMVIAGLLTHAVGGVAQQVPHLTVTRPGGFPGLPVMCDIFHTTNGVAIPWDGPAGYYQLYQKLGLTNKNWQAVGSPSLSRQATVAAIHSNAFFKVQGPSPRYAGAATCAECHENIHNTESYTRHAGAFTNALFVAQGGQTNRTCLPCHTVGYGLPTGFVGQNDLNTNPRLAGVQCESCHGPAAAHAANEMDFTVRPRAELAGQVCGGCHNEVSHRPHYEEWKSSGHFTVTEDMNPAGRINSCGRCHSGSARLALIHGQNPALAVTNDANVGITCAVCHDPHQQHVWTNVMTGLAYTNQLRHALSSTNDFFLTTTDNFTNKYNPNINLCAQCHNHRGASWTSTRPPHHSPQYNMLLGTVGLLPEGVSSGPAAHAGTYFLQDNVGKFYLVTNQCVTCHMQKEAFQPGPPEVPGVTGHKFAVDTYGACAGCHGSGANAEGLTSLVRDFISNEIQQVKGLLDYWALNKAPAALRTNYGVLSWEYSPPGDLSAGTNSPPANQQSLIATNIMKARFNLYLVLYDGSYGTHNGPHAFTLLDAARNWVQLELTP